jgi:hypothetical protein
VQLQLQQQGGQPPGSATRRPGCLAQLGDKQVLRARLKVSLRRRCAGSPLLWMRLECSVAMMPTAVQ